MAAKALYINFFQIYLMTISNKPVFSAQVEKDLLTALTKNYNGNIRPINDSRDPVQVSFDVRLTKLVKLDIKEQQMVTNARVLMKWHDPFLKWNTSEYNVQRIIAPNSLFWTPDIMLYNTASDTSVSSTEFYKAHLRINNNGSVIWMSPVTLHSSCDISVKWFPFDEQSCSLVFGSISMTKDKLDLKFYKQPTSVLAFKDKLHYTSGVWTVNSLKADLDFALYDCCPEEFSLMEFRLSMKRLPAYYVLYLVLPCLSLSLMSLCIFFIPPESGERIGFGITVVLAMSVYLLVISDKLPEKSDQIPVIGVLYTILFFIMIGTLIAVVFTTHLAFKTTKPPRKLRHIFCTRCTKAGRKQKEIAVQGVDNRRHEKDTELENIGRNDDNQVEFTLHRRRTVMRTTSNFHREITLLSPEEEKEIENQDEWKEIATRIDRINFWVFAVLTFLLPLFTTLIYLA